MSGQPTVKAHLELKIDYHGFLIYDEANQDDPASATAELANEHGDNSGMQVGGRQADRGVDAGPVQLRRTAAG
jgi:hypothetical protein